MHKSSNFYAVILSGGSGSRMTLTRKGHVTEWEINKKDSRITIVTDTDEANKY